MKVLFLKGLQGSGKSTWAKEFCKKNKDWVRVNRDDLRNMRGEYWIPNQESMITDWEQACILSALSYSKNVIVDATNLNEKHVKATKGVILVNCPDTVFETKVFDIPLEECIKNDLKRPNSVGEKVIRDTYNKYLKPKKENIEYPYDTNLPDCVLCDLDGTLALFGDKNPYDRDFENDKLNFPVWICLCVSRNTYTTLKLIIVSGRSDKFKEVTMTWLKDNKINYDKIYMRKEGDNRKDVVVKEEMFNEYIRGKYNPILVLDDRNSVVDLWRSLGLTCFQVADGNF